MRYTIENQNIENVDSDASLLVQEEAGESLESAISHELKYDTRDSRFSPHEGMALRLRNEIAGLGGDVFYIKSSVGGEYHYPVAEDWTVSVDAEVGNIVGLGQDTRISDRHFVGGVQDRGRSLADRNAGVGGELPARLRVHLNAIAEPGVVKPGAGVVVKSIHRTSAIEGH